MANIKLLRIIYNEIKWEYCSVRYLSEITIFSKQHIWTMLKMLKAMDLVEVKYSESKANVHVYKLSPKITDFSKLLELYSEKL
jgi:hypothetical protein